MRVKNREVDLLIVVNMFLTGFDATTLNTLWVDKSLKMHGLIRIVRECLTRYIRNCGPEPFPARLFPVLMPDVSGLPEGL